MSNYIVSRTPHKYGGQQTDYLARVGSIVNVSAGLFESAVQSKMDLFTLFHETVKGFGQIRHQIALDHRTEGAKFFGLRRDNAPFFPGCCLISPMGHPYEQYNQVLRGLFNRYLRALSPILEDTPEKRVALPQQIYEDSVYSVEFSLLEEQTKEEWCFSFTPEEYRRLCGLCDVIPLQEPFEARHFGLLLQNREAMQRLKEVAIEDYEKLQITQAILKIKEVCTPNGRDWALLSIRSETDGKIRTLSQYVTWLDPKRKKRVSKRGIISIIHQDPFLIEGTLKIASVLFKEALEWDGKDVKTLKNRVALMEYELAHGMAFIRGSSAIAEWLEMAIYWYHGFRLTYHPDKLVNLEGLTSFPKEFVECYSSMVHLELLHPR